MSLSMGDLKDTVSDLISIDEYQPKTGTEEEIIVVALYAIDEMPAKDVDSFLERSFVKLLDVEVSPNPNTDGYYVIFVEMIRSQDFFVEFAKLVKEVSKITGEINWKVSPYLADEVYDINDDAWKAYVVVNQDQYVSKSDYKVKLKDQAKTESVKNFFKESNLTGLSINDKTFTLEYRGNKMVVECMDFCEEKILVESYDFKNTPINWYHKDENARKLSVFLGESYEVLTHCDNIIILNKTANNLVMYCKLC